MRYTRFPSPRPSPQGRGRMVLRLSITPAPEFAQGPSAKHPSDACCSLSLRERVRVRGKCSVERAKSKVSGGLLGNPGPFEPYHASRLWLILLCWCAWSVAHATDV